MNSEAKTPAHNAITDDERERADRLARVLAWADVPWWEEPSYREDFRLSLEEIQSRINCLRRVFDADWIARAVAMSPHYNPVIQALYGGRGLSPFSQKMNLASTIQCVEQMPGFASKREDLIGSKAVSTHFELKAAEMMAATGSAVRFPSETAEPTPDIIVQASFGELHVECKNLGDEQWELWTHDLGFEVMHRLGQFAGHDDKVIDVVFDRRLSDLHLDSDVLNRAVLDAIVSRVVAVLGSALDSPTPFGTHSVPGVAEIRIAPYGGGMRGSVGGIEVSHVAKLRRLLKNGVLRAWRQVARGESSAIIVHSNVALHPDLFALVVDAIVRSDQEMNERLLFVAVDPLQTIFERVPLLVWTNTHARSYPSATPYLKALADLLHAEWR